MFLWNITLTDKQVIMLAAFNSAELDNYGSQFHAVNEMVGDAWDHRSVRKLAEMNLIDITPIIHPDTGMKTNRWNITDKGRHIAAAMACDAVSLQTIKLRSRVDRIIGDEANERFFKKQSENAKARRLALALPKVPDGWEQVTEGGAVRGDKYFNSNYSEFRVVTHPKPARQYGFLIRQKQ